MVSQKSFPLWISGISGSIFWIVGRFWSTAPQIKLRHMWRSNLEVDRPFLRAARPSTRALASEALPNQVAKVTVCYGILILKLRPLHGDTGLCIRRSGRDNLLQEARKPVPAATQNMVGESRAFYWIVNPL